jgi:hypothetical protein
VISSERLPVPGAGTEDHAPGRWTGMLSDFPPHGTIPVADVERAKAWYRDKLRMTPARKIPEAPGTGAAE